jgi:hypothetical protein
MALGGIGGGVADGEPSSVFFGLVCSVAVFLFFRARGPASVTVAVRPSPSGSDVELHMTREVSGVEALLWTVAGATSSASVDGLLAHSTSAFVSGQIDADQLEDAIGEALKGDPRI